jgi:hypothetical protein
MIFRRFQVEAHSVLDESDTGAMGSSLVWCMDLCSSFSVLPCVDRSLARVDLHSNGSRFSE